MKNRASRYLVITIGLLLVLSIFGASVAQRRTGRKVKPDPAPQTKDPCPESNSGVDANQALARLRQGNTQWQGRMAPRNWANERQTTRCAQHPYAVVLSCMDSRVPAELVFDQGLGNIFVIRVAGPVLDKDQLASLEYALVNVGVKLVVVMGHTDCGAVKGAVAHAEGEFLPYLLEKLEPAIMDVSRIYNNGQRITSNDMRNIDRVSFFNARLMRNEIVTHTRLMRPGVQVKWGLYYTGSGKVAIDPTELDAYQPCPPPAPGKPCQPVMDK